MRISDWSSDVCSSDLLERTDLVLLPGDLAADSGLKSANRLIAALTAGRYCVASPLPSHRPFAEPDLLVDDMAGGIEAARAVRGDRRSGVSGKRLSVRVDLGGGRIQKKKKK